MTGFVLAPGVLTAPLGTGWAAYSAVSGETHLLNDESLAVLEALHSDEPTTVAELCSRLAADHGVEAMALATTLQDCWRPLLEAGLVRHCAVPLA